MLYIWIKTQKLCFNNKGNDRVLKDEVDFIYKNVLREKLEFCSFLIKKNLLSKHQNKL